LKTSANIAKAYYCVDQTWTCSWGGNYQVTMHTEQTWKRNDDVTITINLRP